VKWLRRLFSRRRFDPFAPVRVYYRQDHGEELFLGVFACWDDARDAQEQLTARRVFATGKVAFFEFRYEELSLDEQWERLQKRVEQLVEERDELVKERDELRVQVNALRAQREQT